MIYKSFIESFLDPSGLDIDWVNDTIKIFLADEDFVFSQTDVYLSDVDTYEITGTGYVAGGAELQNKLITTTNNSVVFDADDVIWSNSTITARYGIIYKDTTVAATSPLVGVVDKGGSFSTTNANFSIRFSTNGVLKITF